MKAFFAVLTDEQNAKLFSRDEQQLIRNHIPWTRVVTDVRTAHYGDPIELLPFIRKERKNLVLKPSDEYGGTGVTLGWESDEKSWDATIEKALAAATAGGDAGCWIVQERIPIRREVFPYITKPGSADSHRRFQRHARRFRALSFPRQALPASSPASAPPASPTSPAAAAKSPPSAFPNKCFPELARPLLLRLSASRWLPAKRSYFPPLNFPLIRCRALRHSSVSRVVFRRSRFLSSQEPKPVAEPLAAQNALFDEQYESDLRNFPERATAFGDYRYNDKLNDYSLDAIMQRHKTDEELPRAAARPFPPPDSPIRTTFRTIC